MFPTWLSILLYHLSLEDKWRNLCANAGYLTLVAEPYYHLQMEDKWQNLGDNVGVLPPDAKPVPRYVFRFQCVYQSYYHVVGILMSFL